MCVVLTRTQTKVETTAITTSAWVCALTATARFLCSCRRCDSAQIAGAGAGDDAAEHAAVRASRAGDAEVAALSKVRTVAVAHLVESHAVLVAVSDDGHLVVGT